MTFIRSIQRAPFLCALILGVLCTVSTFSAPALAASAVNLNAEGFAIEGYDPVAYFNEEKAVPGDSQWTADYGGAKYAFSAQENRERFLQDPEKFVPKYGGYCAFSMAHGSKSRIDPHQWKIVDGKIYFMINPGTRSLWSKKPDHYIRSADVAWQKINE